MGTNYRSNDLITVGIRDGMSAYSEKGVGDQLWRKRADCFSISVPVLNVANVVTYALMITGPLDSYKKSEFKHWLDSLTQVSHSS